MDVKKPAKWRTKPAAQYVGLSKSKMDKMRVDGTGPAYSKLGERIIVYAQSDLDTWLDTKTYLSTSEYTGTK
ncbi:MAG: AlpA family phage regulatory protein [Nitrospinae bacterium]|nr:AlpA family phage regulatory protein [Nitrospinota bacterium]